MKEANVRSESRILLPAECRELTKAIDQDSPSAFQKVAAAGADLSLPAEWDSFGETTPLMIAAYFGRFAICDWLLGHGIDPNEKWFGSTPFLELFLGKNQTVELLKLFLSAGADVNQRSGKLDADRKLTPLMLAAWSTKDSEGICNFLIAHGADPALLSRRGWSALTFACSGGNYAVVRQLAKLGAPLTGPCLERPALDGDLELVHLLLRLGADPNLKDYTQRRRSLLDRVIQDWATEHVISDSRLKMESLGYKSSRTTATNLRSVCIALLAGGAAPGSEAGPDSALQIAIRADDFEMVKALVDAGAEVPASETGDRSRFIRTLSKKTDSKIIELLANS